MRFRKICKGLYKNDEHGISLDHESTWRRVEGRKWIMSWEVTSAPGVAPSPRTQKFESMAEARRFAEELVKS